MQTTEILVGAKSLLVQHGWITGSFNSFGGYCLEGAVRAAAKSQNMNRTLEGDAASTALVNVLRSRGNTYGLDKAAAIPGDVVAQWNDNHCKGLEDAIALIDDALLMLAPPAPPRVSVPPVSAPVSPVTHTSLRERVRQLVGV